MSSLRALVLGPSFAVWNLDFRVSGFGLRGASHKNNERSLWPRRLKAVARISRLKGVQHAIGSCCATAERCQKSISSRMWASAKDDAIRDTSLALNSLTVAGNECASTVH